MTDQNYENRIDALERDIEFLRSENNKKMAEIARGKKRMRIIVSVAIVLFLMCLGTIGVLVWKYRSAKNMVQLLTEKIESEAETNDEADKAEGEKGDEAKSDGKNADGIDNIPENISSETNTDNTSDLAMSSSTEEYNLEITEVTEGIPDATKYDIFRVELTKYNFYDYFEPEYITLKRPEAYYFSGNIVKLLMLKSKLCDEGWYLLTDYAENNSSVVGDIGYFSDFSYTVTVDHVFNGEHFNQIFSSKNTLNIVNDNNENLDYDMDTFEISAVSGTLYFVSKRIIEDVHYGYIDDRFRDIVGSDMENNTKWGRTITFKKDYSLLADGERCNYLIQGDTAYTASDIEW